MGLGADARINIEAWLMDKASAALDAIKRKVDALGRQLQGLNQRLGQAGNAIRNVDIKTMGDASEAADGKVEGLRSRMVGLGGALMTVGSRIRSTGQSLTIGLTTPIVAAGYAVTTAALDYNRAITRIITLTNHSEEQVAAWSDEILAMAGKVGIPPTELADALFYLSSAGLPAATVMDALEAASMGAALGMGTTKDVGLALIPILNAYSDAGITAGDAVGMLTVALKDSSFEVDALANSMPRLIFQAHELGVPLNDLLAVLGAMSHVNTDANEAVTDTIGIFRTLWKPSAEASEMLAEYGESAASVRAAIVDKGFLQAMRDLEVTFGGNIEKLGVLFPRVHGLTGFLNLTGQAATEVDAVFAHMAEAGVSDLETAFAKLSKSDSFKMDQAQAEMQASLIILGSEILPYVVVGLQHMAHWVGVLGDWFSRLSPWVQKVILGFFLFLAVMGPLLIVFGAILSLVGVIMLVGAVTVGVILLVIVVIVALVAAAVLIYIYWDLIKEKVGQAIDWLRGEGLSRLKQFVDDVVGKMQEFAEKVLGKLREFGGDVKDTLARLGKDLKDKLQELGGDLKDKLREFGEDIKDALDRFGHDLKDKLRSMFADIIDPAIEAWQELVATARFWWNILWWVIQTALRAIWAGIVARFLTLKAIFTAGWGFAVAVAKFYWNILWWVIQTALRMIWAYIQAWFLILKGIFTAGWGFAVAIVKFYWSLILLYVALVIAIIQGVVVAWFKILVNTFMFFGLLILNVVRIAWALISGFFLIWWTLVTGMFRFWMAIFRGDWGAAWEAIKDTAIRIWNIVKDRFWVILGAIVDIAKGLWDTVKENAATGWEGIKTTILGVLNAIKDEGRVVLNAFVGIIEAGINGAIDIVNGFSGGINSVSGALNKVLPGPDMPSIPEIPHVDIPPIDTGGLIRRTGIALVHRGELVLNELQQRQMGGAVTYNYDMTVTLARGATRKDAENLIDWIEDEQRKRRRRGR